MRKRRKAKPMRTEVDMIAVPNPAEYAERLVRPTVDAVRSLRDDPLARLHARKQITDDEYRAGRRMQQLYEAAEGNKLTGIDFSAPVVDRSFVARDGITDRKNEAAKRIAKVETILGRAGAQLVRSVLAEHTFINQIASGKAETTFMGRVFRMHLRALAVEFGFRNET